MRKQLRPRPVLWGSLGVLAVVMSTFYFWQAAGEPLTWSTLLNVVMGVFYPALIWVTQAQTRKATRRRLFIYEPKQ